MIEQVVQITGSLLVLIAFVAAQLKRLRQDSLAYLVLNTVGSGTLAVVAILGRQWGFLLLEASWALVSAVGMFARFRRATGK